jgi:hypothetical protein
LRNAEYTRSEWFVHFHRIQHDGVQLAIAFVVIDSLREFYARNDLGTNANAFQAVFSDC